MRKKLISAFVAMFAFAAFAALPSGASAAPCVTDPAGTCLATGNLLRITNEENITLTTSLGNVVCSKANITGKLTTNDHTNGIVGDISTADFTGTATSSRCTTTIPDLLHGGTLTMQVTQVGEYCLRSTGNDTASIGRGLCTAPDVAGPRFIFDVFGSTGVSEGSCEFERSTKNASGVEEAQRLTATYNTNVAPATGTFEASQRFRRIAGTTICPSEGTLDGKFLVYTDNTEETGVSISE
jgi:hypothetical protein